MLANAGPSGFAWGFLTGLRAVAPERHARHALFAEGMPFVKSQSCSLFKRQPAVQSTRKTGQGVTSGARLPNSTWYTTAPITPPRIGANTGTQA